MRCGRRRGGDPRGRGGAGGGRLRGRGLLDGRPGAGPLGGLEAGLAAAANEVVLVVASDMPFGPGRPGLLAAEALARPGATAVVLEGGEAGAHLGAYRQSSPGQVTALLDVGRRRMSALLAGSACHVVPRARWTPLDPQRRSLVNLNSPSDVAALRRAERSADPRRAADGRLSLG
ncbi:MAG: NTP transferase domain-containing protein [Chloroflexota bacterium]